MQRQPSCRAEAVGTEHLRAWLVCVHYEVMAAVGALTSMVDSDFELRRWFLKQFCRVPRQTEWKIQGHLVVCEAHAWRATACTATLKIYVMGSG